MIFRVFQIVVRYSSVLLRLSGKKLKNVLGVIGAIQTPPPLRPTDYKKEFGTEGGGALRHNSGGN